MARITRESASGDIRRFHSFTTASLVSSVLSLVIGVLILVFAEVIGRIVDYIVGGLFIYYGINAIYNFIRRAGAKMYSLNLIFGIIAIALGLVILVTPFSVTNFINVCFGLYLILMGANKISYGVWLKIGNDNSWGTTFVVGLLILAFGILLMVNPFEATMTETQVVGIFMILASILDITYTIRLRKRSEEIVKIFW